MYMNRLYSYCRNDSEILECFIDHDHLIVSEYPRRTLLFEAEAAVRAARATRRRVLHAAVMRHSVRFGLVSIERLAVLPIDGSLSRVLLHLQLLGQRGVLDSLLRVILLVGVGECSVMFNFHLLCVADYVVLGLQLGWQLGNACELLGFFRGFEDFDASVRLITCHLMGFGFLNRLE